MTEIEKNTVRDMVRMAEVYGSIYEPRYRTIATNAFLDGMAIHGIGTMIARVKATGDMYRLFIK